VAGELGAQITVTFTRASGGTVTKTLQGAGAGKPIAVALSSEDVKGLGDGQITVSAVQTDAAGNSSTSPSTATFKLDTFAAVPNAQLSGAGAGGLTNTGALTAPTNREDGALVEYRIAPIVGSDPLVYGPWSPLYVAPSENGPYSVEVRQTDLAGNVSAAQSLVFTLDKTPPVPTATITAADDDVGTASANLVAGSTTDDNTPTLKGSVSASLSSDERVVVYDTVAGNKVRLGVAVVDGTSWTFTPAGLSKGAHALTAQVEDAAGNASAASASFGLTIDSDPPSTTLIMASASGPVNLSAPVTVTATLSAPLATGEAVRVFQDGVRTDLVATVVGTSATFTVPAELASGLYRWSMAVSSGAGLIGPVSPPMVLTVDKDAPSAPTISAVLTDQGAKPSVSSGESTRDKTLVLTGFAADPSGVQQVEIFDGETSLGLAQLSPTGAWTFSTGNLADGSHALTARATDKAGNLGAASSAFTVTVATAKPATPTIAPFATDDKINIAELANVLANAGNSIALTGIAAANAKITITLPGGLVREVSANESGAWTLAMKTAELSALGQGSAVISVVARDAVGNVSDASTRTVEVDTRAPALALQGLDPDSDTGVKGDSISSDATPTIRLQTEAGAKVSINWGKAGESFSAPVTVNSADTRTFTLTDADAYVASGTYQIQVKVEDGAGNVVTRTLPYTLDLDAPAAPASISTPLPLPPERVISLASLPVRIALDRAVVVAGDQVQLMDNGAPVGNPVGITATDISQGFKEMAVALSSEGSHAIGARFIDQVGNVGAVMADANRLQVTVDRTAPAAPVLALAGGLNSGSAVGIKTLTEGAFTVTGEDKAQVFVSFSNGTAVVGRKLTGTGAAVLLTLSDGELRDLNVTAGGSLKVEARQIDLAGNVQTAAASSITLTLDTTPPVAGTLTLTDFQDTGLLNDDRVTSDKSFGLSLSGHEVGAAVQIERLVGSSWVSAGDAGTTAAVAEAADGLLQYRARVTDAAGNVALSSQLLVRIDSLAPKRLARRGLRSADQCRPTHAHCRGRTWRANRFAARAPRWLCPCGT